MHIFRKKLGIHLWDSLSFDFPRINPPSREASEWEDSGRQPVLWGFCSLSRQGKCRSSPPFSHSFLQLSNSLQTATTAQQLFSFLLACSLSQDSDICILQTVSHSAVSPPSSGVFPSWLFAPVDAWVPFRIWGSQAGQAHSLGLQSSMFQFLTQTQLPLNTDITNIFTLIAKIIFQTYKINWHYQMI